jgi:hypothetical protein
MTESDEAAVWVSSGLDSVPAQLRLWEGRVTLQKTAADSPLIAADVGTVSARRVRSGVIELRHGGEAHVVLFFPPLADQHTRDADGRARRWVARFDALTTL